MKSKQLCLRFIFVCYAFAFNAHASGPSINEKTIIVDPTRPDIIEKSTKKKPLVKAIATKKHTLKRRKQTSKRKREKLISRLSLQQTLISEKRKLAVISGKTLTIGKKIHGAKLIKINLDNVVLRLSGKQFVLNLAPLTTKKEALR